MKIVTINKYHKKNGSYVVFLGNGTCHKFSQDRQAKKFLNTTSKFLTSILYDMRYTYSQIEVQYNRNWGYFLHDKKTMTSKRSLEDNFCKETLRGIQDQFDLIVERCEFTNGNYFAFQKSISIIKECKRVVHTLDKLHKSKSNAVDRYEYDAIFDRLTQLETKINNYTEREAHELFTVPVHLDKIKEEFLPVLKIA
jgi:tetrahydromethanopterin S-methyltransferase subunit G